MNLDALVQSLNRQFLKPYHTVICGGYPEPFYKAAQGNTVAEIQFTKNFVRSALHELGHWLVAGPERRTQDDFGYWYAPDGRSQAQQNTFFQLEIKPQAIEWALSKALVVDFEVSVDNLTTAVIGGQQFERDVAQQLAVYEKNGFPKRTQDLLRFLSTWHQSFG